MLRSGLLKIVARGKDKGRLSGVPVCEIPAAKRIE
jgi:hypothetical protein